MKLIADVFDAEVAILKRLIHPLPNSVVFFLRNIQNLIPRHQQISFIVSPLYDGLDRLVNKAGVSHFIRRGFLVPGLRCQGQQLLLQLQLAHSKHLPALI